mmetsp:Transcript_9068/g.1334  ORF Transcript_9068/g.1334 Transcript_9068/m.1334 type:complete len:140 (+) Transcript_9068:1720-2139(+)
MLTGLGLTIFYFYVHKIHNDGSLPDNYLRLTAPEHYFHIPYDSEVSKTYLKSVIRRAHVFDSNGVTREVSVVNYQTTNKKQREKTYSVISIYNMQGGEKQLFRNFIRLSNGAICELSTFQYRSYQEVAKELEIAGLKQT